MNAPSARELLAGHGLRAKRSWGQNFLVDRTVQERIVEAAGLGPDDVVVEIGAGLGALTVALAARATKVVAIERDPDLARVLTDSLAGATAPKVEVSVTDALAFDFTAASRAAMRPLVVVGNLPYQITSPLLFGIAGAAAHGRHIARAILMVQREFAERMIAPPGNKVYGRLSVMVQQQAEVKILFHVGASSFYPRPAVTSSVLKLVPRARWWAPVSDEVLFSEVVRAAFGARRKMLRGALGAAFGEVLARSSLRTAGIDETRRAETLEVAELARLSETLGRLREVGGA